MQVELSRFIASDLEGISDETALRNPCRAAILVQQFRKAFQRIGQNPFLYQLRPDIGKEARIAVVSRYVILFWIDDETVRIERILFGGRDLPSLFPSK